MRKGCQVVLIASVSLFLAFMACADIDIKALRAELANKSKPIKSLTCHKKVSLKYEEFSGVVQVSSEGTVEYARADDGKDCYRAEEVVTTKREPQETSTEKLKAISDGVLTRVISSDENETNETAMPSDLLVVQQVVGKGIISSIECQFKLGKVVQSTAGNEEVYVVEAEPKEETIFTVQMGPLAQAKFIIARKNAVLLKIIHLDRAGKEFGNTDFTDHKFNLTISPTRFNTNG